MLKLSKIWDYKPWEQPSPDGPDEEPYDDNLEEDDEDYEE